MPAVGVGLTVLLTACTAAGTAVNPSQGTVGAPPSSGAASASPAGSGEPSPTPSAEASSTVSDDETLEPRGEVSSTLPPVEQPEPRGGPWQEVQATVTSEAEVAAATDLPESFRAYLGSRLGVEDDTGCSSTSYEVLAVHADGFAYGSEENTCHPSSFVVWGIEEGQWRYLLLFQDPPLCGELERMGLPVEVPGLACEGDDFQTRSY